MKRKITLKQIARELDVSISTVSKSLKDSHEISEDTKLKVQAFARMYNYKPNNIALSLKNKSTKNIAVIIPDIVHYFFATIIKGIEEVAKLHGYNVVICLSDESFDKEVINMEMLANGSIDGFIISLSKETLFKKDFHHITEVINQGMPVVMFDRIANEILCDKVIIDDANAAFKTTEFLIDKKHKNIAIITTIDYINVGKLRTEGYIKALSQNDLNVNTDLILKIEDVAHCYEIIEDFIAKNTIDAIFAVNEMFAVNALKAAKKLNIDVPNSLSIIGFTDGIISQYSSPALSTVSQNELKMGRKSAEILINRIENEDEDEENEEENELYFTEVIETNLVLRETTL